MSVFRGDLEGDERPDPRWYVITGVVLIALVFALAVLGIVSSASAQSQFGFCGYARVATPRSSWIQAGTAYQQVSVSTTAVSGPNVSGGTGITIPSLSTGGPIVGAVVEIQSGLVNLRVDGTAATGTTDGGGSTYGPGGSSVVSPTALTVCGTDLRNLSMIRSSQSATNPLVNIRYYVPGS